MSLDLKAWNLSEGVKTCNFTPATESLVHDDMICVCMCVCGEHEWGVHFDSTLCMQRQSSLFTKLLGN
eukprot:m.136913 g.136913  ORF g.136913 m.136913 type:complete len:68 (-) comp29893_c5_seq1:999-1202(-)